MGDHPVNELELVVVRLTWVEKDPGPPATHLLRGAVAWRFPDNALFHQHDADGLIYRYPRIQYRWERSGATVVGFGEGVRSLLELPWAGLSLRIGSRFLTILEAECSLRRHVVQPTDRLIRYRFDSPWIPFNQANFLRYRHLAPEKKASERDRLAVAGLLIGLRGLDVSIDFRLFASFELAGSVALQIQGVLVGRVPRDAPGQS